MSSQVALAAVDPTPMPIPMPTRSPDPVLADQLTIVRGMLSTLESLTHAGQQYLTGKVISFVEDRAPVLLREMSGRSRRTFLELLTDLRHEHDRLAPDVTAVVRRGEHLIALLAGVA